MSRLSLPKIRVSMGSDFGDTGKGAQNSQMTYEMLSDLGVLTQDGYGDRLLEQPLFVLEHGYALLNVTPFGAGNAGNHIYLQSGEKVATHLLPPAAVWTPYTLSLLGAEKTVNLETLHAEIGDANGKGCRIVPGRNLFIDTFATLTLPQDIELDRATSQHLRGTFQGSGPSSARRRLRYDPRAADLRHLDDETVQARIKKGVDMYNVLLHDCGAREYSMDETMAWLMEWRDKYGPDFVVDGRRMVRLATANPNAYLFINGTQGPGLDGDTGTIGNTVSYGVALHDALKGAHLPVSVIQTTPGRITIVRKAYNTRAGSGVFPGEFDGKMAERLQDLGGEIGVTSGNRRRVGADDLASTRDQVEMCVPGLTDLAVTKVDVLGALMEEFGSLKPIIGYKNSRGEPVDHVVFPDDCATIEYGGEYHWGALSDAQRSRMVEKGWPAFPEGLQAHLITTARVTGAPVSAVGLGPRFGETATRGLYEETAAVLDD